MATAEQATKQFTFRMPEDLHEEVKTLSALTSSPMSKWIVNAIKAFVVEERLKLIRSLEENLAILRNYASRDPDFEEAIEMIAASETDDNADPVEGVFFNVHEKGKASLNTREMEKFFENA